MGHPRWMKAARVEPSLDLAGPDSLAPVWLSASVFLAPSGAFLAWKKDLVQHSSDVISLKQNISSVSPALLTSSTVSENTKTHKLSFVLKATAQQRCTGH